MFSKFSLLLHIYSSRRNFFVLSEFHIFSRLDKSWGDKQNVNFRLKTTQQAKKKFFFEIFFDVALLLIETILFCYYQNFISSAVQRNHGGTRKSVTSTNDERTTNERRTNERTTNDERRTTLTIIRPRQDSFRIIELIIRLYFSTRFIKYYEFGYRCDLMFALLARGF